MLPPGAEQRVRENTGARADGHDRQVPGEQGLRRGWVLEWLRRERRAVESRSHLRAARETFDGLGASGETSRHRVPRARDSLAAQELQIALMAADGLTNREIGQRLYLSHRTIGSHLHRLFPKLGVASRAQLRGALQSTVRADVTRPS